MITPIKYNVFSFTGNKITVKKDKNKTLSNINQKEIIGISVDALKKRIENREAPKKGYFINVVQMFPTKDKNINAYLSVIPDEHNDTKRTLVAAVKSNDHSPISQVRLKRNKTNDEILQALKIYKNNPEELEKTYDNLIKTLEEAIERTKKPTF